MLTSKVAKSLRSINATLSSSATPRARRPPAARAALARISGQLRKRSPEVTPAFIVLPFAVFRSPLEHDRARIGGQATFQALSHRSSSGPLGRRGGMPGSAPFSAIGPRGDEYFVS